MIPSDLSYDWPQAVYGILLTLLFIWLFWRYFYKGGQVVHQAALPQLVQAGSPYMFWLRALFFSLSWLFAVLAIMQPKGNERYASGQETNHKKENHTFNLQRKAHDILFLIDASASMNSADTRSGQTRLDAAKEIADELISRLKGENVGIYAFTSAPSKISPLTLDYLFARLMLKNIQINEGGAAGTDFYSLLSQISQEYFQNTGPRLKTIILISDGGDTGVETVSGEAKENKISSILNFLNNADALHLRVYTIGVGSQSGAKVPEVTDNGKPVISQLDPSLLQRISSKGRGKYFEEQRQSVVDIASSIITDMAQDNPYVDNEAVELSYNLSSADKIYSYFFQWPLALSILFLILALFLPERISGAGVFLLFFSFPVFGVDLPPYAVQKLKQAGIDQEAGAAREALDAYQSLSDLPLSDWQKAVLQYDRATVLLDKQPAEAVKILSELVVDPDLPPLIRRRAFTNLAIGRFRLAESKLKDENNIQAKIEANFFYLQAQDALNSAYQADCQLVTQEGGVKCEKPLDLKEIGFAIRRNKAAIMEEAAKDRIKNSTLEEGVALLYTAIDQLVKAAQLSERANKELNYAKWVAWQGEATTPVWPLVKAKLGKEPPVFKTAYDKFHAALASLQKGRLNTARLELLESKAKLDAFVEETWGANALHVYLTRLLDHFRPILSQDVIPQTTVDSLLAEAKLLKSDDKQTQMGLENIQDQIAQASKLLKSNQAVASKMVLLSGREILTALLKKKGETPQDYLQAAIDKQQYALDQNMLWSRLTPKEQQSEELQKILGEAQQSVLETASHYLPKVLEWQQNNFHSSSDNTCQCRPWNTVLPRFNKGYQEALLSNVRLKTPLVHAKIALESQDQTIKDWRKALEAKEEEKEQEQPQPKPSPSNPQKKDEKQRDLPSNTNQVLQTLQDMQKADQGAVHPVPVIQKGSKPW